MARAEGAKADWRRGWWTGEQLEGGTRGERVPGVRGECGEGFLLEGEGRERRELGLGRGGERGRGEPGGEWARDGSSWWMKVCACAPRRVQRTYASSKVPVHADILGPALAGILGPAFAGILGPAFACVCTCPFARYLGGNLSDLLNAYGTWLRSTCGLLFVASGYMVLVTLHL